MVTGKDHDPDIIGERRRNPDRRSGLDRRGSGLRLPPSSGPRPYRFRSFDDRRCKQDRRLYRGERAFLDAEPAWALTPEEICALFGRGKR